MTAAPGTSAERVERAARSIADRLGAVPEVAIVLGSGLGPLAQRLERPRRAPYSEIAGFPTTTIVGHQGELVAGTLGGIPVLVQSGRFHLYEGHSAETVVLPVRAMATLGVRTLILTNAAGGLNSNFRVGDLMLISDVMNLMGDNPLRGPNDERLGPRFPGMRDLFSPAMMQAARGVARREGIRIRSGVYAGVSGPSYETAAEIRMLRRLGADAVGMSTVPEVLVARHAGIPNILGIACITNVDTVRPAGARRSTPVTHAAVLAAAARADRNLATILRGIVARL